jgi:hypothetical protein
VVGGGWWVVGGGGDENIPPSLFLSLSPLSLLFSFSPSTFHLKHNKKKRKEEERGEKPNMS